MSGTRTNTRHSGASGARLYRQAVRSRESRRACFGRRGRSRGGQSLQRLRVVGIVLEYREKRRQICHVVPGAGNRCYARCLPNSML